MRKKDKVVVFKWTFFNTLQLLLLCVVGIPVHILTEYG